MFKARNKVKTGEKPESPRLSHTRQQYDTVHARPGHSTFGGLCATCEARDVCVFPRQRDNPIRECQEYVGSLTPLPPPVRELPLNLVRPRVEPPAAATVHLGLCVSCVRRATCGFARPEGGVWQCDEYA